MIIVFDLLSMTIGFFIGFVIALLVDRAFF